MAHNITRKAALIDARHPLPAKLQRAAGLKSLPVNWTLLHEIKPAVAKDPPAFHHPSRR
jgi:hypothetical protein